MGLFYAILAAIFAFTWRITLRTKIKDNESDIVFTALVDLFAALTALLLIPFFGFNVPAGLDLLGLFIVSAVLSSIGDFLMVYATKNADTADTSILSPLSNIWVLIFASIFLNEQITLFKVIGVLTIVLGSVVALRKSGRFVVNKGIIAMFVYGFLITATILIDKGISSNFSVPVYACLFYLTSGSILTIASGKKFLWKMRRELRLNNWWIVAMGVQWALFTMSLLSAYTYSDASKAVPIVRFFIVLVTIYSIFVLKEIERKWQKIVGSVIVTIGALILAYFG